MKLTNLSEPELEFAGGLRHVDPRAGIVAYGPADANSEAAPREIRVALVGDAAGIEGLQRWLECCREPIAAKESHQDRLFPEWPGFASDHGFRSTLVFDERDQRTLAQSSLRALKSLPMAERVARLVDEYIAALDPIADDGRAHVMLCVRPDELLEVDEDATGDDEGQQESALDFHDLLKARAMRLARPIQLVRGRTFGATPRKSAGRSCPPLPLQDEATRAWNIHAAIYYKAGGAPWRLHSSRSDETVCYVGVSFFEALDRTALHTGVAQVFNELGDGVVVRGGEARRSKQDRQVHLGEQDAHDLLVEALDRYRQYHRTLPARVVLHKSSPFDEGETCGFLAAAAERSVFSAELIWLPRREDVRLFRLGVHPPLRGTLLALDSTRHVLYTRGSVPQYATYPGMYVPQPLGLRPALSDRAGTQIAEEVLGLTKLNWNNTQFDGREPVTLRIADRVGSILRYLTADEPQVARYAFYM